MTEKVRDFVTWPQFVLVVSLITAGTGGGFYMLHQNIQDGRGDVRDLTGEVHDGFKEGRSETSTLAAAISEVRSQSAAAGAKLDAVLDRLPRK